MLGKILKFIRPEKPHDQASANAEPPTNGAATTDSPFPPKMDPHPMLAHARVDAIRDHHFDRGLEVFAETTEEIFDPPVAASVHHRAVRMGAGLRASLRPLAA